jgi:hypothetical protein
MLKNFSRAVKATMIHAPLAAGQSTGQASAILDMQNFDGVCFVGSVGSVTASGTATLTVLQCTSTGGTFSAISTASAQADITTAHSDLPALIEVYRPQERYLQTYLIRATANVEFGGVMAYQYDPRTQVVTQGTTIAALTNFYAPQTT